MTRRGAEIHWCWAGLATCVVLGFLLSEAHDLLSPDERLAGFDGPVWLRCADLGVDDVAWSFRITPLTAWWAIGWSLLLGLIGWNARRDEISCPFGVLGGGIWLAMLGFVFADNLLLAFAFAALLSLLTIIWLYRQAESEMVLSRLREFALTLLIGDALAFVGVLLAGIAWETLDAGEIASPNFALETWQRRPALYGVAGICLFLGLTARFGWLIFGHGLRVAAEFPRMSLAVVFCSVIWPGSAWLLVRLQPLLSHAPETVSLAQGISCLAALTAAVIATAQSDSRRAILLVATSQFGLLVSVLVVPDLVPAHWRGPALWAPLFAAALLFVSKGRSQVASGLGWWLLAAGCLSPMFLVSAKCAADLPDWQPPAMTADIEVTESEFKIDAGDRFRVRPLPVMTWTAAWCLWSFFATFAAWRAWKGDGANQPHLSFSGSFLLSLFLGGMAVLIAWFALPMLEIADPTPACAAIAAAWLGQTVAISICREPAEIDRRYQRLGVWASLANREFYWNDVATAVVRRPLSVLLQSAGWLETLFVVKAGRGFRDVVLFRLNSAVEELRTESANFYASALAATIGSLLLTWLALTG